MMIKVSSCETAHLLTAKDTVITMTSEGQSPVDVKAMIADYLRDGRLRAYADAVWLSSEPSLYKAWLSANIPEDAERKIIVPTAYWRTDKKALDDRARWRWPYNRFFYTLQSKPLKRRMFKGVKFLLEDLTDLQPRIFLGTSKRFRGRKPDVARRDAGWLAAIKLAQSKNFNAEYYLTQQDIFEDLMGLLLDANGEPRLGETQVREIASMLHKSLKPR